MEKQLEYKYDLPIGDWSGDGHGKMETYTIKTNYPKSDLQEAYLKTCKKFGVYLHRADYTEYWRDIFCEYQDNTIHTKALDILVNEMGFLKFLETIDYFFESKEEFKKSYKGDEQDFEEAYLKNIQDNLGADTEILSEMLMWFISLTMPDDFKYEFLSSENQSLFGNWDSKLNVQMGYGLFF